jgi:hypothetical protein
MPLQAKAAVALSSSGSGTLDFASSLMAEVDGEEALRNNLRAADTMIENLGANNRYLEEQVSTLGSNLFKTGQEKDMLQKQLAETLKAVRNMQERKDDELKVGPSQADVDAANKKMMRCANTDRLHIGMQTCIVYHSGIIMTDATNRVLIVVSQVPGATEGFRAGRLAGAGEAHAEPWREPRDAGSIR